MKPRIQNTIKKFPVLFCCILAGVALMVGVFVGKSSGPTQSIAQTNSPPTTGTPTSDLPEPKEPEPRNLHTKDSLIVSDNSGIVNVGGSHYHAAPKAKRTPATRVQPPVTRVIIKPIIVERVVERLKPRRIWTRPGIPARSRLGVTMLTLKRFEDAGVRIYAEN